MNKLVITSRKVLEVGKVYSGMSDPWAKLRPDQRIRIVAVSTREEWVKCLVSFGEEEAYAELISGLDPYFYEFQTD